MRHPYADSLDAYATHLDEMGVPLERADAVEMITAWHRLGTAGDDLHRSLAECLGLIGEDGRCGDCGRLVVVGAWKLRSHKDGGCLLAIPLVGTAVWCWHHPGSVPLVGQALYRARRRRLLRRGPDPTWNGSEPG